MNEHARRVDRTGQLWTLGDTVLFMMTASALTNGVTYHSVVWYGYPDAERRGTASGGPKHFVDYVSELELMSNTAWEQLG